MAPPCNVRGEAVHPSEWQCFVMLYEKVHGGGRRNGLLQGGETMGTEKFDLMLDAVLNMRYGITATEAYRRGICVKCRVPMSSTSSTGLNISDLKEDEPRYICGICSTEPY